MGKKHRKRNARPGARAGNTGTAKVTKARKSAKSRNAAKWLKTALIVIILLAAVSTGIVYGARTGKFRNQNDELSESGVNFPAFVRQATTPNARRGYLYAVNHSDELKQIPCFCGCGKHAGHKSVHDCFIKWDDPARKNTLFDEHGANCKMCIDIVLEAVDGLTDGKTLQQVRNAIEEQWQDDRDSMTPTPPIVA